MRSHHPEEHRTHHIGWLRAAVLGANDGIVSTASLLLGVVAAQGSDGSFWVAGVAALVAGAMSMAAGEYVSVSSQADIERAEIERERRHLASDLVAEQQELAAIYAARGLSPALAQQVAVALMAHDALGAHVRDELGLTETGAARPLQAALSSAASFAVGAAWPLLVAVVAPRAALAPLVAGASLLALATLGALAARAGGAHMANGAARVTLWGALAMAITAGVGALVGQAV